MTTFNCSNIHAKYATNKKEPTQQLPKCKLTKLIVCAIT